MERFRGRFSEQTVSVSSGGIDIYDRTPDSADETLLCGSCVSIILREARGLSSSLARLADALDNRGNGVSA